MVKMTWPKRVAVALLFLVSGLYYSISAIFNASSFKQSNPEMEIRIRMVNISPIGKSEYDRYLQVKIAGKTVEKKMFLDWGGATRTNLYRSSKGFYYLVGPVDAFTVSEIGEIGKHDQLEAANSNGDDMEYLGTFDIAENNRFLSIARIFTFISPDEQAECIETRTEIEVPPLFRPKFTFSSCPRATVTRY
jgi:hypothetical protein